MNAVIGQLLPIAIAIAISPVALVGATRMALPGRDSGASDVTFLGGWFIGVVSAVAAAALLSAGVTAPLSGSGAGVVRGFLLVAAGVYALVLAGRAWRVRPLPGEFVTWPTWMAGAHTVEAAKAGGLGFALGALAPKNLLLCGVAGVVIGTSGHSPGADVLAVLVVGVVSAAAIVAVVLGYRASPMRTARRIETLALGVEQYLGGIEPVVLTVVGALAIGAGLGSW